MNSDHAYKIVLIVDTVEQLKELQKAYENKCATKLVTDKGFTVFDEPTTTCLGIGPIPENLIGDDVKTLTLFKQKEKNIYKFVIRENNWYKRRSPTKQKTITKFEVINFTATDNSYCDVTLQYDDELETKHLTRRVTQNYVTGNFLINGINPHGDYILLDVKEIIPQ